MVLEGDFQEFVLTSILVETSLAIRRGPWASSHTHGWRRKSNHGFVNIFLLHDRGHFLKQDSVFTFNFSEPIF